MYDTHARIYSHGGAFWILDGHLAIDAAIYPVNCPESRVLRVSTTGALILCVSSHKRLLMNDFHLYNGSYKEWLAPIMGFNMFNPVKTYRMVRNKVLNLSNFFLVGEFVLGDNGSCF